MNVDELLREYGAGLPMAEGRPFDELIRIEGKRRHWRTAGWAGALAAGVLLGAALWSPRVDEPVFVDRIEMATSKRLPVFEEKKSARKQRVAMKKRVSAPYDWSGFVAVAEMSMLPKPESWRVLRVSVSRDRLAALGVVAEGGREEMAADVLVSDDGMTRAVRVVDRAER